MSVGLVTSIIIYVIIAILHGIMSYMLIVSDIELLDIMDNNKDIYLTAIICGVFWIITIPILIYNSFIKKNKE